MEYLQKIRHFTIWPTMLGIAIALTVGAAAALNSKLAFFGMMAIFTVVLVLVNWRFVYKWTLIAFLTIPFNTYDFFKLKIPSTKIDVFSALFFLMLAVLLVKALAEKRSKLPKLGFTFFTLAGVLLLYIFVGYGNAQPFLSSDIRVFLFYVVYILSGFLFYRSSDGIKDVLKITIISTLFLSILVILMYYFKTSFFYPLFENSFYANDTRVGTGNQSFFIFSIPILIAALLFKALNKRWSFLIMVTIVAAFISVLLSESRALMVTLAGNVVITLFVCVVLSGKRFMKNIVKLMVTAVIMFSLMFIFLSFFPLDEKLLVVYNRFNEYLSSGTTDSYQTRAVTNIYTIDLIKEKLFGYGLGAPMVLYDGSGMFANEGTFIDNGFLTLLYKVGIPGFLCFAFFYLTNFMNIYKYYRRNRQTIEGKLALIVFLCIPLFLVNCMYFTAQLVMNGAVFSFMLFVFAFYRVTKQQKLSLR